jgi:hypothetical protein
LVSTSLLACFVAGGSFLLAELHNVNPAWIVFAWSSMLLVPVLWKEFRAYFRDVRFRIFFVAWMCVHGATVTGMIAWVSFVFWPLILLTEFVAGFIVAHWLFHFPLDQKLDER